ncbi:MAG: DUF4286 family protein [Gammaproteobacteria bacterium]
MNSVPSAVATAPIQTAGDAVIYEVTLDVDRRVSKRFDTWLKQHMRDMLALPGFLEAQLLPPDKVAAADARSVCRVVQYRLASRSDLDNYLNLHAARMRAESVRHFGKRIRTSRRLLDAGGNELVTGSELAQPVLRCQNCNSLLTGKFCAECGQKNHTYAAPLWADIQDFSGNHFGFDTKFFHSILPLLFRPGFLSREYSAGRRVRYINPLRLYFFSSLLFFFVAWTFAPSQFVNLNNTSAAPAKSLTQSKSLTPAERQKIWVNPYLSADQKQLILNKAQQRSPGTVTEMNLPDTMSGNAFGKHFSMPKSEFKTKLMHAMESYLPKLMFLFLPLVALLLKLCYLRSRRYYMEHLIFTLHNHAFVFVAMLLILLANLLATHVPRMATPTHYFNVIIGWYIAIYIFLAMRFYYRQSYFKTAVKYLLIGFIYWLTLLVTFIAGLALIFAEVVAA